MKKLLMLSVFMMVLGACGHYGHKSEGCGNGKPCPMESKDDKKGECEDCKKGK